MSASMRNFMEAYSAVHSTEAREELTAKRDEIAEMDLSGINDEEIEDLCEEALGELLDEGYTVEECEAIFITVISEAKVTYGHDTAGTKAKKTDRLERGLKSAIGTVKSKASKGAVKAYGAYRDAKANAKMQARRAGQTTKNMSAQAQRKGSEMKDKAKSGIKSMLKKGAMKVARGAVNVAKRMSEGAKPDYLDFDKDGNKKEPMKKALSDKKNIRGNDSAEQKARLEKKRGMKLDDHPQFKKEGYMVMNKAKVDSQKNKAYDKDMMAQSKGDTKEADKQFKRRMAMDSMTKMKKEELELQGFTESEIERIIEVVDTWEN